MESTYGEQQDAVHFLNWHHHHSPAERQRSHHTIAWPAQCPKCGVTSSNRERITVIQISSLTNTSIQHGLNAFSVPVCTRCPTPECDTDVHSNRFHLEQPGDTLWIQVQRNHDEIKDHSYVYPNMEVTFGDTSYQLDGLIVHDGVNVHTGHYYAYVRYGVTDWYACDDHQVTPVEALDQIAPRLYLAVYRRKLPHQHHSAWPDTHFAHKIITAENTSRTGLHTRDPLAVTTPKYLPPAHLIVTDEPYAHVPQNNYIISPLTTTHTAPPL